MKVAGEARLTRQQGPLPPSVILGIPVATTTAFFHNGPHGKYSHISKAVSQEKATELVFILYRAPQDDPNI